MIDARGYSCPMPVVMAQKACKTENTVEILVDNHCSVENITRFARNQGFSVETSEQGEDFKLVLTKR